MARGDFPFDVHCTQSSSHRRPPSCTGRNRRSVEQSQARRSDMQIKETIGVSFPGSVESPPLEDVVVLVDSPGVALGAQRAFCARGRGVRDGGSGLIASRYVEIPLVESDGEVSGVLCHTCPRSDTRGAVATGGPATPHTPAPPPPPPPRR